MKILRLRFKNLNSLAGEWDIDFTHPDYVTSGIFAITGPTGAGKTTILDGICLSLYGQTPRLGKITQSGNEIMSRQLGECASEVEFETARGRFRCHWSQHRARKMSDGKLQSPRHEIVDAVSGKIIESKLTAVAGKVEEVTGMDFDRFTRSMLLAQGGFAAFLQARPDERAPILEQITGTEIYSRVSIKVHECTSVEREKLKAMLAELDGMQLLTSEEEADLLRELVEKQKEEAELSSAAVRIREAQTWVERIAALEHELMRIEQAYKSFYEKKQAAVPELEQLERAGHALSISGDYACIKGFRGQQATEQSDLTGARERLPNARQMCQDATDFLGKAEAGMQNALAEQAREADLIRVTRELDVKLGESRSQVQGLQDEINKLVLQKSGNCTVITDYVEQAQAAAAALRIVESFLADHTVDASLAENLTGIEQQVRALKALDRQCSDRSQRLVRQTASCNAAAQTLSLAETALQGAVQTVAAAESRLGVVHARLEALLCGRGLSAWRTEAEVLANRQNRLDTFLVATKRIDETIRRLEALKLRRQSLEQSREELGRQAEGLAGELVLREEAMRQLQEKVMLLNRVRDLEAERAQLVDGVACPLCGHWPSLCCR
jgi:exonuclease SbcC